MNRIKLLSLDLDGTLLRNDKTVSEFTVDVLRRCREKGIIVAVNTGRNENTCVRLLPYIIPDVLITSGGAAAKHGEEPVYKAALPETAVNELIRRCVAHPAVSNLSLDIPGGYLAQFLLDPSNPLHIDYKDYTSQSDFSDEISCEVYRMGMLCSNPKAMEEIIDGLPGISLAEPEICIWREIQSEKAGKWQALTAVAERLSINVTEIAAFGDDWNDLDMISNAGFGIAMGNAQDGIKAAAREVCGTNEEDGAARWIEEHVI